MHPQTDAASRTTLLYSSDRTRVARVQGTDGRDIIYKEPLGPDAVARVRTEREILSRLEGIDGVPQLAPGMHCPGVIAVQGFDGVPLAQLLESGQLPLAEAVRIGIAVSRILVAVHARAIAHGDINPCNIVLRMPERHAVLIDYHLAFAIADETGGRPRAGMAGTLLYMAPEQTGRTGRVPDQRADLYGLGCTLYEMLVGRPPFTSPDAMQLMHDQLTLTPPAPAALTAGVPAALSDIVMKLLEKDPERRYQSAAGLCHDLGLVAAHVDTPAPSGFALATRDFPLRLAAPRSLAGRQAERAALLDAFERAIGGDLRGVVLTGAEGVGKTSLAAQLRRTARERGGHFVAGEFDPQERGRQASGAHTALRALGQALLARPEAELARIRADLLAGLGVNVDLAASHLPEFGILLGVPTDALPAPGTDTPARLVAATESLLRAVASPGRPVVIALGRLESASPTMLKVLDGLMLGRDIPGLLLVLEWRDAGLPADHPLAALLPRWCGQGAVRIGLDALPAPDIGMLLQDMLRMPAEAAARLGAALAEHTGGNPYYTVELVNALRDSGVLRHGDDGWTWDPGVLRRHVGASSIAGLVRARLDRLPRAAQAILETMACLGGHVRSTVLAAAAGVTPPALSAALAPALEDGLVTIDSGGDALPSIAFAHDRVRQAAHDAIQPGEVARLRLAIARRLDGVTDATLPAAAQYLHVAQALEGAERQRAVALFREAAAQSGDPAESERLLRMAVELAQSDALRADLRLALHDVLLRLGRNDDADAMFALADPCAVSPVDLGHAACRQLASLHGRHRPEDALALGMRVLEHLGFPLARLDGPVLEAQLDAFGQWLELAQRSDLPALPELRDPRIRVIAMLLERCASAAFMADRALLGSIVFATWRLWRDHGVCAPMLGALAYVGTIATGVQGDYRLGYDAVHYLLALAAARGYTIEGARVRWQMAITYGHWFEPVERCVEDGKLAHEVMMQGGDLLATLPLIPVVGGILETAPALSATVAEANAALAVILRTGSFSAAPYFHSVLALASRLQGKEAAGASPAGPAGRNIATPVTHFNRAFGLAMEAALLGDQEQLAIHAEAAYTARRAIGGTYKAPIAVVLHAVALAQRARRAATPHDAAERAALLEAIGRCRDELARHASDAPANFGHLLGWIDAERAWTEGAWQAAALAFDGALDTLEDNARPWHRALITERAGQFHMAHGMRWTGRRYLADARLRYVAWGATAKVAQLEGRYPFLAAEARLQPGEGPRRDSVSADSLDLLGLLRASQTLSSETSLDKLQRRVVEQLQAMTGATHVRLVQAHHDSDGRVAGELPLSAIRYVERTRLPLVLDDAGADDRFAADPYLHGKAHCSLLLLPVLNQGVLRAVLLLENDQRRGAFSADRLQAVTLIAGQLAVSLDNAILYDSLERKVAERTEALEQANRELAALSVTDALTGLSNRRRFDAVLETEWVRTARQGIPLGAAMIDVDQFKLYNDHYGHQQGDECLQQVAAVLARHVRHGIDLAARYGGEEFAVILPGADIAETRVVAERIRAAVEALGLPHLPAGHGRVTVSIGIAALLPQRGALPATLFGVADKALYEAKKAGRNRVLQHEM